MANDTRVMTFKFQYDNTLSGLMYKCYKNQILFKFQYDNTLREYQ